MKSKYNFLLVGGVLGLVLGAIVTYGLIGAAPSVTGRAIGACQQDLETCRSQLDDVKASKRSINSKLAQCKEEKNNLQTTLDTWRSKYNQMERYRSSLAQKYAEKKCCDIFSWATGEKGYYSITGGAIYCYETYQPGRRDYNC